MKQLIQPSYFSLSQQRTAFWLAVLVVLFSFRVFAQLLAYLFPVAYLPAFNDWHSAMLPYPVLLASQIIILYAGVITYRDFSCNKVRPDYNFGNWIYILGWIYWLVMVLRLLLGLTVMSHSHWFAQYLPALFHLILANILLLIGNYHRNQWGQQ